MFTLIIFKKSFKLWRSFKLRKSSRALPSAAARSTTILDILINVCVLIAYFVIVQHNFSTLETNIYTIFWRYQNYFTFWLRLNSFWFRLNSLWWASEEAENLFCDDDHLFNIIVENYKENNQTDNYDFWYFAHPILYN